MNFRFPMPVDRPDMKPEECKIPLFSIWVATLEKIRHKKPLFEPKKVVFHMWLDITPEFEQRMYFKNITFESSDSDCLSWRSDKSDAVKKLMDEGEELINPKDEIMQFPLAT